MITAGLSDRIVYSTVLKFFIVNWCFVKVIGLGEWNRKVWDSFLGMTLKAELLIVCNQTWIVARFGLHVWFQRAGETRGGWVFINAERLVTVIRSTWESAWAESTNINVNMGVYLFPVCSLPSRLPRHYALAQPDPLWSECFRTATSTHYFFLSFRKCLKRSRSA